MKHALSLILFVAVAGACAPAAPRAVTIAIHYSHYSTTDIEVPAGVPITFTIRNDDPIDHEWMLGDMAMHERHRTGAEAVHASRPDELTIPAMSTRTTTLTFPVAMTLQYMCHLPGHEAYGMVGVLAEGESRRRAPAGGGRVWRGGGAARRPLFVKLARGASSAL